MLCDANLCFIGVLPMVGEEEELQSVRSEVGDPQLV